MTRCMRLVGLLVAASLLGLVSISYASQSVPKTFDEINQLTTENFEESVKEMDSFVMFYAPWYVVYNVFN